jgi:hypothetical protein
LNALLIRQRIRATVERIALPIGRYRIEAQETECLLRACLVVWVEVECPTLAEFASRLPVTTCKGNSMQESRQSYLLMKFTVLQQQTQKYDTNPGSVDGYAYAWACDLYPALHDEIAWHMPFYQEFDVSEAQVRAVFSFLTQQWSATKPVSFHELERHMRVVGRTYTAVAFDRYRLCRIVRYLWLSGTHFDVPFWATLLERGMAPPEALTLATPLRRDEICPL